ncbi:hypothetical protein NEOLEDRAFT_1086705 [Neolentinus lepideus HHB14362 ss-1]|uniref:Condensation domain-containing protein n=1 Tax=Neolentinus lepideus HHB14362 ss-1 TaxID=1314782 RepID=A0A165UMZ2_9AGAM|nr:hypothetical protein NEOLEDRAFT_1086705 [Neolentinus lepideus HHB14362 ss-1]
MDVASHSWRCRSSTVNDTLYVRLLGLTELGFYWDSIFNGTADVVSTDTIKVVDPSSNPEQVFSKENISRAWMELKRRYPLLGARIVADERKEVVEFEVSRKYWSGEEKLGFSGIEDLSFMDVGSPADAYEFSNSLNNGPRQLSQDLLARLYILRQTTDRHVLYVTFHIAHVITDGMANAALRRILIDLISSRSPSMQYDLEDRLYMVRATDALDPNWQLSIPRRRWKRAIGRVMAERRQSVFKGGHTLLRHIDATTPATPAMSCETHITLAPLVSSYIISTCRKNKITFGHAHPVLGQLALARVLHRCRHRGEISEKEWQWRRREPMHNGGPLNVRPFLDKKWLARGGEVELMIAINFFFCTLPFMPSVSESECEADGTPPFSKLLSRERFFYRCKLIKNQTSEFLRHPLFLEIASARLPGRIARVKFTTLHWIQTTGILTKELEDVYRSILAMQDDGRPETNNGDGLVTTHGGSSMGNIDNIVPLNYPLPTTHSLSSRQRAPRIPFSKSTSVADKPPIVLTILDSYTLLHCRPAELYLGATTSRDMLYINVFWDGNVYDSKLVKEWLEEVKNAALWYLGDAQLAKEVAKL